MVFSVENAICVYSLSTSAQKQKARRWQANGLGVMKTAYARTINPAQRALVVVQVQKWAS
jgi:hypothetical protein